MTDIDLTRAQVGDELPSLVVAPITRQTLAIYCGASGDHNPIHVDIDFARASGLDDVIAHGMLIMAYMGRAVTGWVSQEALCSFDTRFQAMTCVGDQVTVTGEVVERFDEAGEGRLRIAVAATDQNGEVKTVGSALVRV